MEIKIIALHVTKVSCSRIISVFPVVIQDTTTIVIPAYNVIVANYTFNLHPNKFFYIIIGSYECMTCSNYSTNCSSCNNTSQFKYMALKTGQNDSSTCLVTCPSGYFSNYNDSC
jgi:hypothetical protein